MSDPYGNQPAYDVSGQVGQAPYAPHVESGPRPLTLTVAIVGMWIGAVLAVVMAALPLLHPEVLSGVHETETETATDSERIGLTFEAAIGALLGGIVQLALWIWMAAAASKTIGWARVVATVLGVIGILVHLVALAGDIAVLGAGTGRGIPNDLVNYVISETVVNVAFLVVAIAILVLLWLPPTSAHYRVHAKAKQFRTATAAAPRNPIKRVQCARCNAPQNVPLAAQSFECQQCKTVIPLA